MCRFDLDHEVVLRRLQLADAEALFALTDRNRQALRQWLPWLDAVRAVEDTRDFLQTTVDQHARGGGFQSAILVAGQIAGVVGYHEIDRINRIASIGYWLGTEAQGRGIMTKACAVLTEHAFTVLDLNRVEIACATGNSQSRAIPERLGFRYEGTLRDKEWLYDHYVDLRIYAMRRADWPALSG